MTGYRDFFQQATGHRPYPYQERLADAPALSGVVSVPTGAGKTAAVILAWLWRRRYAAPGVRRLTPRRLVYCLPMRTLVEQTATVARGALAAVGLPTVEWAGAVRDEAAPDAVGLAVAMGGEPPVDWDLFPDLDAVVIGTQDMLLSRALNRGYGSSRYRWPLAFGLLNNDALWVHDEVQLMGDGLATSAQLAGLRRKLGVWGQPAELWLSATMRRDWLATFDFAGCIETLAQHDLSGDDRTERRLADRLQAAKTLECRESLGPADLAEEVVTAHAVGEVTLVVVNTVARAVEVYREVLRTLGLHGRGRSAPSGSGDQPEVILLHSRFRARDRERALSRALSLCPPQGRIVVSTQVVEAGVDMSSATMFTDLAPWASLVQRFGRCNRKGEREHSRVVVVALDPDAKKEAAPYEPEQLQLALDTLRGLGSGASLSPIRLECVTADNADALLRYEPAHVLRRRDLLDLFDTTPDIGGSDVDVSRFVRNVRETDAYVFWRAQAADETQDLKPRREELCPVPVGELRKLAGAARERGLPVQVWDHLAGQRAEGAWVPAQRFRPGEIYLAESEVGGYSPEFGWEPLSRAPVIPVDYQSGGDSSTAAEADGDDLYAATGWETLPEHTDKVVATLRGLLGRLEKDALCGDRHRDVEEAILQAARWHDRGKAHPVFQQAIQRPDPDDGGVWAKAPTFGRYSRYGFRHELASALAAREEGLDVLVWYLVAAHHGKVRLALRALPDEIFLRPGASVTIRGVEEGDELSETPLGGGTVAPAVRLTLGAASLGRDEQGRPGWSEAALRLRDRWPGLFRLAYLEALVRSADVRASARAGADAPVHDTTLGTGGE